MTQSAAHADWPAIPYEDWAETAATLHMWTQIVGKVRMALTPPVNHWWHVPLYVSGRGLTTSPIPWKGRSFEIAFDFIDHRLEVICSDGRTEVLPLKPQSVAEVYAWLMAALGRLGITVKIWTTPCEVPDPIPFEQDETHRSYDPEAAQRFWRALVQADRVLKLFRGRFLGKASPTHFFWGSFDLASTRFSGRHAPPHPGSEILPASVSQEAYSHEVWSAGFWPGAPGIEPLFYAYAYPEPPGFRDAVGRPGSARYDAALGEFVLPYEAVRRAHAPDFALLIFLQSTYEAAADLGGWPRAALERRAKLASSQ
jgi:energy-converting hydrogenase Eha subunit F